MYKAVESGQGQIALSFVDELNKVISGFLECYHRVQENWLAAHLAEISKILLHTHCALSQGCCGKISYGFGKGEVQYISSHGSFF